MIEVRFIEDWNDKLVGQKCVLSLNEMYTALEAGVAILLGFENEKSELLEYISKHPGCSNKEIISNFHINNKFLNSKLIFKSVIRELLFERKITAENQKTLSSKTDNKFFLFINEEVRE